MLASQARGWKREAGNARLETRGQFGAVKRKDDIGELLDNWDFPEDADASLGAPELRTLAMRRKLQAFARELRRFAHGTDAILPWR